MGEVNCINCSSPYTYMDRDEHVCTQCNHRWKEELKETKQIVDMNGTPLNDRDNVIVMNNLKIKGSKDSVKKGTKVRNIRLLDNPIDGHDIACKIDGLGQMNLKSEFVRKIK